MQLHLDLMGGLAGDMFIASVLDAFPEHVPRVTAMVAALGPHFEASDPHCGIVAFNDGIFGGSRFVVGNEVGAGPPAPSVRARGVAGGAEPHRHTGASHDHDHDHDTADHDHDHDHGHGHAHGAHSRTAAVPGVHVPWLDLRARLHGALTVAHAPGVLRHALGIFELLADAEAEVHGVAVEAVEFHEVGAWDSVVDIVGAACLIDALDARRWSVSAVPLGSGRVRTAHGPMPVPPPATARLLRGFATLDDGVGGERVTPTGAAILKYLIPDGQPADGARPQPAPRTRVLRRCGVGFGTRRLAGISNCVRLLAFDDEAGASSGAAPSSSHRELAVVEFEVDDQSAEELSIGLERLRAHDAIFDVVQAPVFGKKGRMMTSIRLLARPTALAEVVDACFRETTTIGLRHTTVRGEALPRWSDDVIVDGHRVRVKSVERPGGTTAKAESDDALDHETHRARRRIRMEAERLALDIAKNRHV